ncbi:MAG TPA: hypothetical protein PLR32_09000 [candidate division Zixibacteria bacterium]|nr:hypothetical protein [candidate division Zixibacteria bacterium]MDD4917527.1 hypothetical protein [candidate division Zixibacteria bacterium]MDM7972204.1 hypothetical protein [candidate division Zixibacteria bacterium]HOD66753.1 hypothetical protein [candidate division Zixibacteria bacterium]HOZ06784.1 hypothetical protein [candidate division Zixibacteria bacterium]
MKPHYLLILLALAMLAGGAVGLARTGSPIPLLINSALALLTLILALVVSRDSRRVLLAATVWVALCVLLYTYMTIIPPAAHNPSRPGSKYLFGSMALVALIVLVGLSGGLRRRRSQRRL